MPLDSDLRTRFRPDLRPGLWHRPCVGPSSTPSVGRRDSAPSPSRNVAQPPFSDTIAVGDRNSVAIQATTGLIIKGIWAASLHWCGGQPFEDAEDFAYRRFSWRVKDDLAPDARPDLALQVLASSIPLGMLVFRDLQAQLDDPAEHDAANNFIDHLASLGFDLRLYMPQMTTA